MATIEKLKCKRDESLIVVCTLGFGAIFSSSIRPVWMKNLFKGTSINKGVVGFVLKCLSYVFLALFTAAIMFVINLFKLIYYQIEISKLKH
ncbi:MAG: hypothetical protein HXX16_18285 [Bacteroidales bacterium]|nr:hypothetical protein [Bacteroidales bacterium]